MTEETPDTTVEHIAEALNSIAASLTDIVGLLEHLRTFGMPTQQ